MLKNTEEKVKRKDYFDSVAVQIQQWRKKSKYFHQHFKQYLKFLVPDNSSVLEIGCEIGDVLAYLNPRRGLGIVSSQKLVDIARKNFPQYEFKLGNADDFASLNISETFDYIIISNYIGYVSDIQNALEQLKKVCQPDTRVILVYYNYFWQPIIEFAEAVGLKMKRPLSHWFSSIDLEHFLYIADFEVIKKKNYFLIPIYLPLISNFVNKFFANIWPFRKLSLIQVLVSRLPQPRKDNKEVTCSVIVPCRNEKGNIEQIILRTPIMGQHTEIIFIEGHSQDGTLSECERVRNAYPHKDIRIFTQEGIGKADAMRKGFAQARGDILMILDADLTVPPEELPKFFQTIISGKGEFVSGSRLVYKMDKQAMRFLNILGNKFFSYAFTFLLEQYIKDTLCGTKVLWRKDYDKIVENRKYFGDFDPFGDFDLLFGAAKLNLKILEVPVHYRERIYGTSQIRRFKHGWLLLKMTCFALGKIKFL